MLPPGSDTMLGRASSGAIAPASTGDAALDAEIEAARADPHRCLGPFLLLDELGRGGMGVVYRAWNDRLRRLVAVKTILADGPDAEQAAQRFEREAQAIARLKHPSIVSIHEVGFEGGRHFLAMDLVAGTPLDRLLQTKKKQKRRAEGADRLPLTRGLEVIRDVARAVHHAHGHGVIHRDLKPGNVIVDPDGKPFVLDFGLATVRGQATLTKTGTAVGTPAYMPPEQADGQGEIDGRADVWSLGATLYQLLAGRVPFEGTTDANLIFAILTKDPVPPGELNRRAAGDLETICLHCLEKEPDRRYPTAEALADDIDRYLAGDPITARPIGIVTRFLRRLRRQKLLAAVVLAAIAGLLAAGVVAADAWGEAARSDARRLEAERLANEERLRADKVRAEAGKLVAEERSRVEYARMLVERAERMRREGRLGEAALLTAAALEQDDAPTIRFAHALCLSGPWRAPGLLEAPGGVAGLAAVAWSPDGGLVVAASSVGHVIGWDVETAEIRFDRPPVASSGKSTAGVAISPDGRIAAAIAGNIVRRFELPDGRELEPVRMPEELGSRAQVNAIAWLGSAPPELAVGLRWQSYVLLFRGTELSKPIESDSRWTSGVASDGTGRWVTAADVLSREVRIFDARSGRRVAVLPRHRGIIDQVAWSRTYGLSRPWGTEDRRIVSGSNDRRVRVWELDVEKPGGEVFLTQVHRGPTEVKSLAFDPGGRWVASSGGAPSFIVWDLDEAGATWRVATPWAVAGVTWSPTGDRLAAVHARGVGVFTVREERPLIAQRRVTEAGLSGAAWRPGSDELVTATLEGREPRDAANGAVWSLDRAAAVSIGNGGPERSKFVRPSRDGRQLAIFGGLAAFREPTGGHRDRGCLGLLELGKRTRFRLAPAPGEGDEAGFRTGDWHPDGRRIISAGTGKAGTPVRAHVWDVSGSEPRRVAEVVLQEASPARVFVGDLVWSDDGRTVAALFGRRLVLVDGESLEVASSVDLGGHGRTPSFSPDGSMVAVAAQNSIEIRSVPDGQALDEVSGTRTAQSILVVAWSGRIEIEGQMTELIAGGDDERGLSIWRVRRGEEVALERLAETRLTDRVVSLDWDDRGRLLAGTGEGIVTVFDVPRMLAPAPSRAKVENLTGLRLVDLVDAPPPPRSDQPR